MKTNLNNELIDSSLKPFTMEEIDAMIDRAEIDIALGNMISHEVLMREIEEELQREEHEEFVLSKRKEKLKKILNANV